MPRKIAFDSEVIEKGPKPTATVPERLRAFQSAGLPSHMIADTAGVAHSSLQNWLTAGAQPHAETLRVLDDIRYSLVIMSEGGLPHERAAMVLRSRNDLQPYHRPMEIIAEQPDAVFEIAHYAVEAWAQAS